MPRFPLMPREDKFFNLLERSSQNMVATAVKLKEMLDACGNVTEDAAEITDLEHKGDSITHEIIALLHRTFVTPFDREDIASLAQRLDDVTDLIHAAADAIVIYKISTPTHRAKELANIIVEAAITVDEAVPLLEKSSELKSILRQCIEINRLENAADQVFRAAMGELFEESRDIAQIIKWREIYEHLELATDRCEDVANVLEGVALKLG